MGWNQCKNRRLEVVFQLHRQLQIKIVTSELWDDFESLFESRGGPKNCWCMVWRDFAVGPDMAEKAARKAEMRRRVVGGEPVGLLGYFDGNPVAWCSVAPRSTFKASLSGTSSLEQAHSGVWAITCFFVRREYRGHDISGRMVEAAEELAAARNAVALEAHPVDVDSPSYRFSGFVPLFERHGFHQTGTIGTRRKIFVKTLRDPVR